MSDSSPALRAQLRRILSWQDAHVGFEKAVEGLAPKLRGVRVDGFPHSAWELLEHLRITQRDILDFCRNPKYQEMNWPEDYWPKSPAVSGMYRDSRSVNALRLYAAGPAMALPPLVQGPVPIPLFRFRASVPRTKGSRIAPAPSQFFQSA